MSKLAAVGLASLLTVALTPGIAFAHGDDGDIPAKTDVQVVIAVLRSQPEQTGVIEDKLADAQEADDTGGVDLGLVRQAQRAFMAGDLAQTEFLLERSLGHTSTPPPDATLLAVPGRGPGDAGTILLLLLALVCVGGGVVIAQRHA